MTALITANGCTDSIARLCKARGEAHLVGSQIDDIPGREWRQPRQLEEAVGGCRVSLQARYKQGSRGAAATDAKACEAAHGRDI